MQMRENEEGKIAAYNYEKKKKKKGEREQRNKGILTSNVLSFLSIGGGEFSSRRAIKQRK